MTHVRDYESSDTLHEGVDFPRALENVQESRTVFARSSDNKTMIRTSIADLFFMIF